MNDRTTHRKLLALILAALSCVLCSRSVGAQDVQPAAVDVDGAAPTNGPAEGEPSNPAPPRSEAESLTIEGGSGPIGGIESIGGSYYYESPVQTFGTNLFFTSYVLTALVSVVYLAVVYPLQALFGSNKVEPVMLWNLLPVVGPWFAQYEDSVKSKAPWRVLLVTDAALQATGVVVGLIGWALSGRRPIRPTRAATIDLQLGAAGAGPAGFTLSIHTL